MHCLLIVIQFPICREGRKIRKILLRNFALLTTQYQRNIEDEKDPGHFTCFQIQNERKKEKKTRS